MGKLGKLLRLRRKKKVGPPTLPPPPPAIEPAASTSKVPVTDLTRVLSNLRFNADANAAAVVALWGDATEMEGVGGDFDVVLGSDLVPWPIGHLYEPLL